MSQPISILIIEDEEPLLETLKLKLEKEGFKVDGAADGKQGLDKIYSGKPDLLLLDLVLPSMTGQDILRELQKTQDPQIKKMPVVVISNSGQPVEIKEVLALGADDYIIKANFTIDDVLERVYNALEKKSGQPDVLVAEDESFLRMVLAKKLRLDGLKVVTTIDGDNTLRTILEVKPKAIVLDLLMPGLSGLEVLETLSKDSAFHPDDHRILVLSNYSGKEGEPIIKKMTVGYLIKSNCDIDDIAKKVGSMVEEVNKGGQK
ncbi:MAG: hypothetical protein A2445_00610 [Candidatus Jacksonbacteria bacterium RIFOXYC2_FULL_44_29]|nr:MAG: Two-component hybrid sensor and regulator [Parcubacteria group bacterium GW2011_GWC2_44_22]OGY76057.1 MAG: hypothetical protein A2295_03825 [Candidatus Jacksonbacteria bacterium RIFOXYB2_FULL_44_15]OGY76360.1 MAG: hypothetical protein A2240_04340 [Candidatus Jacksonbacteria bacterium RIFOXYA2_FULL_43_12]OGY77998.1 MAG: hypothetical protein A2445_00610 [Candidatus Jacksonbacteria bacterium RIFOXYC2_FULL_44_29]OGY80330.1 MAG: hypothetical protein A2550_04475 [Candidatus Jacksonbacteria ba